MADFAPAVPRFFPEGFFTQEDFLRLFDRLLPDYYISPLKNPGPGYEYLQAVAKTMSRLSEAASHMASGSFIGSATGGRRAYATVELTRESSVFGAVDLRPGTLVGTADGYLYQTLTPTGFGVGDTTPRIVEVEAIARGWDWNKPGPALSAGGELLSGSINRLVAAVVLPTTPGFDPTIKIRQVSPTDTAPYALDTTLDQPAVGGVVRMDLAAADILPRVGAIVYIGTEVAARDEYRVDEVLSRNPYRARVTLISAGLNAPGTSIPVSTPVYLTSDAYGGESMALDGLGIDRGVFRNNVFAWVRFDLTAPHVSTLTFMPGTQLKTADDYLYQLLDSVNFPANTTGPQYARAIPVVLPDDYASHGPITDINFIKWGSNSVEGITTVAQIQPYTQESDDSYRARVALLPYVVTPNAVQHLLDQLVGGLIEQAGQIYSWREIWDIRFQTAYDLPANLTFNQIEQGIPVPDYNANIFAYDYEPEDALSNRYLFPSRGMIVFALPEVAGLETAYAGLASALDAATPAGISLAYIKT